MSDRSRNNPHRFKFKYAEQQGWPAEGTDRGDPAGGRGLAVLHRENEEAEAQNPGVAGNRTGVGCETAAERR
jgi:hypothetical protein